MPSFNQVTLVGHLTKEPVLSYLPSQTAVCNFGIAVNDNYTDSSGTKCEKVCFVDCTLFGKRAEAFNKYLKKGNPVLITGKLQFDTWVDKEDKKHYKHSVAVREFSFIGSNKSKPADTETKPVTDDDIPF